MNENEILSHCVIVQVTRCEKETYWYADLVGKCLVAYGYDNDYDEVYCCHKDNKYNSSAVISIKDCQVIQGSLNQLKDLS